jgi:hypothetical protein
MTSHAAQFSTVQDFKLTYCRNLGGLHTERLRDSGHFGEALFLEESLGKPFHTGLQKFKFCDFPDFSDRCFLGQNHDSKSLPIGGFFIDFPQIQNPTSNQKPAN